MNIQKMTLKQLRALQRSVGAEIERRENAEKKKVIDEVLAFAKARGLKLEEVVLQKKRGRKASPAKPQVAPRKRAPAKVKYRHPEQASLTWTGRGRQPKWVAEWMAAGKALEALAV